MKILNYIVCFVMVFLLSCSKELTVSEVPSLEVTVESPLNKVNEEVVFNLTGKADMISFYSGEIGNDFAFKDGRVFELTDQGAFLSFSSAVTGGAQSNQLSVMVSTDFNGKYDNLESVKAATWTDITDRFVFGTNATFKASGNVDISDIIVQGAPLFVGFKYLTKPQATEQLARNWMIQGLVLSSKTQINGVNALITDQPTAGFTIVDEDPDNAPARSQITATRVSLLGNMYKEASNPIFDPDNPIFDPKNPIYVKKNPQYDPNAVRPEFVPFDPDSPYNDPRREHWAISRPIYTDKVNFGPDLAIPIRGIRNEQLEEYRYVYKQSGTYKAYFVASNNTIDNEDSIVKEITITITDNE